MASSRGITGAPDFTAGQGGVSGPGTGNPPVPPSGTSSNDAGNFAPIDGKFRTWTADSRLTDSEVDPGAWITSTSPPADTTRGWVKIDSSMPPNFLGFYAYVTGIGWQQISAQGPAGPAGPAGSGTWCPLNSDFTAGAIGAGNLYCNSSTPNSFPTASEVQASDTALNTALYQVTAMSATPVANPTSGPTITATTGTGTFTAGVWYVGIAFKNAVGSTQVFLIGSVTLASGQVIAAGAITPPPGCTVDYYVSPSVGSTALQFYTNRSGSAFNITGPGVGAAEPTINTTQGLLLTRLPGGSGVSGTFVFAVANGAQIALSGVPGPPGATGSAGTPRNTTISNGGAGFDAGNFASTYTVPVASGTGGYDLPGDWIKLWDGTASAYYTVNSTATSSVNATRQNVPGDPAQASPSYNFTDGTQVSWIGAPGAPGSAGSAGASLSPLSADFTAGAENATGLTASVSNPAPFFVGAILQEADNTGTTAWYQATGVAGSVVTMTRLAVDPPGITVAGPGYVFEVANGAMLSISGPPGSVGTSGGTLTPVRGEDLTSQIATSNVTFTLLDTPYNGKISLYLSNVRLRAADTTNGYSVSGNTITMITAPVPGSDWLEADYEHA